MKNMKFKSIRVYFKDGKVDEIPKKLWTETAIDALDKPQRTGKWIFPYGDRKYKKCSACERVYYSIPHDSNYCPNCGCRMTEEKA